MAVASIAGRAPRSARRGSETSRGAAEPCLALLLGKAAKSPPAAAARGLVMGVFIVVRAKIR